MEQWSQFLGQHNYYVTVPNQVHGTSSQSTILFTGTNKKCWCKWRIWENYFASGVSQSLEAYAANILLAQTGFDAIPVYNSATNYTTSRTNIKQKFVLNILSFPLFSSYVQMISCTFYFQTLETRLPTTMKYK